MVLGLILTVSLMSINSLQKQKSEDSPTETAKDIFQSEEQADTEVEFSDLDNQQDKEDLRHSEDSKESSDAQKNSISTKQESSKDSEEVKETDETKDSEQEKDPESGGNTGNSGNDELWTGYY